MIKKCSACGHMGELTWRDGEYHCAMCDNVVTEDQPQTQHFYDTRIDNPVCPVCKNKEDNQFDGSQYRCALCGTPFVPQQVQQAQPYVQFSDVHTQNMQRVEELKKEKNRNLIWGIVFIWLFWPVSIYFFYKFSKIRNELKALGC